MLAVTHQRIGTTAAGKIAVEIAVFPQQFGQTPVFDLARDEKGMAAMIRFAESVK